MTWVPKSVQRVFTSEITALQAFLICGTFGVGFSEFSIGRMFLSPWLLLPWIGFGLAPMFFFVSPFRKSDHANSTKVSKGIPRTGIWDRELDQEFAQVRRER
jgi:hypothetical protein